MPWLHQDLIDPKRTIWTVAASLRRALEKHGEAKLLANDRLLLGKWWAGFSDALIPAAQRKAGDIAAKGPNVHATGAVPAGWSSYPGGATSAADDAPPAGATGHPGSAGGWLLSGVEHENPWHAADAYVGDDDSAWR
jgi:hypothetical protein